MDKSKLRIVCALKYFRLSSALILCLLSCRALEEKDDLFLTKWKTMYVE